VSDPKKGKGCTSVVVGPHAPTPTVRVLAVRVPDEIVFSALGERLDLQPLIVPSTLFRGTMRTSEAHDFRMGIQVVRQGENLLVNLKEQTRIGKIDHLTVFKAVGLPSNRKLSSFLLAFKYMSLL
jgi:hypothetical protein